MLYIGWLKEGPISYYKVAVRQPYFVRQTVFRYSSVTSHNTCVRLTDRQTDASYPRLDLTVGEKRHIK